MNAQEQAQFVEAMAETEKVMERVQASLQHARSQSHGEVFVQVDLMSKRAHELKVKSEWLRHVVLGMIELPPAPDGTQPRQEDRRSGIDRRIAKMQSELISLGRKRAAA
jgi:vacuolar-type H+-ATPase subunit D/Vma8